MANLIRQRVQNIVNTNYELLNDAAIQSAQLRSDIAAIIATLQAGGVEVPDDAKLAKIRQYLEAILAGYMFGGVVTPDMPLPASCTNYNRIAFLAVQPGTYTAFNGYVCASNSYNIFFWSAGTWSRQVIELRTYSTSEIDAMFASLCTFGGVANNATVPVLSKFYIIDTAGTYDNFNITVRAGEQVIVYYSGNAWTTISIGSGGSTPVDYTLTSAGGSLDITNTETGQNAELSSEWQQRINNKQDIPIAGGLQTNGIEVHYFAINHSTGISAPVGSYIPLFKIESHDNGKSQLAFEITSREDTSGYYAKYLFVSHGSEYALMRMKFTDKTLVQDRRGIFSDDAIVVLKYAAGKYMIFKKVLKNSFDFFVVNDLFKDVIYADIYCYTTKASAVTDRILLAEAMSSYDNITIYDHCNQALYCENNLVTSLSVSSTDEQVPSAKAVYDAIEAVRTEALTRQDILDIIASASQSNN